jgi:hypothetical protein
VRRAPLPDQPARNTIRRTGRLLTPSMPVTSSTLSCPARDRPGSRSRHRTRRPAARSEPQNREERIG